MGKWKRGETREGRRVRGEECLEEMEERGKVRRKDEEMQWRRMKEREGRRVLLTGNHQKRRGHC